MTSQPQAAIDSLTNHQEQCDMDGVMVQVSRQALDEVLSYLRDNAKRGPIMQRFPPNETPMMPMPPEDWETERSPAEKTGEGA